MELTADLPSELVPLAWLIGSWAGAGVGGHPSPRSTASARRSTSPTTGGRSSPGRAGPGCSTTTGERGPPAHQRVRLLASAARRRARGRPGPRGGLRRGLGRDRRRSADRPAHRRRRPDRDAPRSTPPGTGSTAWSRATWPGRTTSPHVASPCRPACPPGSSGSRERRHEHADARDADGCAEGRAARPRLPDDRPAPARPRGRVQPRARDARGGARAGARGRRRA